MTGSEFIQFAILNLGFIGLSASSLGAHVSLRPGIATSIARAALGLWLAEARPTRLLLSQFDEQWRHRMLMSGDPLWAALVNFNGATESDSLIARQIDVAELARSPELVNILEAWRAGVPNANLLELCRNSPTVKFLAASGRDVGLLRIHALSPRMLTAARAWRRMAIGQPINSFVDGAYGRWVASAYATCALSGRPDLAQVHAAVSWSNDDRTEHRYLRLLVPLPTRAGDYSVLCASSGSDAILNPRFG
jgi:hypothetical protein